MKVCCYVRISHASQNEASQRREIQRWLDGHSIANATWFTDTKTGDHLDRPAFTELQKAVFAGEVELIVVYRLERISRSLIDGINTLVHWIKAGIRVVSVTQQLDFSGTVGQLIAATLFAVGQMEQETRRERQAHGIAAAKQKGIYLGRKSGTTKAKPKRAQELKAKGLSPEEIATAMGVSRSTVFNYLNKVCEKGDTNENVLTKGESTSV